MPQLAQILPWVERRSRAALGLMTGLFVLALFAGLTLKLQGWGQGYDQIDYQQSIWNTTQGRFLEISHYRHTDHLWGMDFIPAILLIVPFYALLPSALTLNFFQALCMGLGALPTYAAARDRLGSRLAGLGFAAIYLLYPSTWFATMSAPWQPRTLAVPLLIGAFYFLQRGMAERAKPRAPQGRAPLWGYLACLGAALLTRTDASLCVLAFGLLALAWRAGWRWALPPIIVAAAWFALSTSVFVPSFYRSDYQPQEVRGGADACEDYSKNWPGKSPQLAYYCHLGASAGEIVTTIVTQPIRVAQIVLTPPKMSYLLLMLLPLLLLPLLAPDAALPALPILALNLLTNRPFQYTVREQYQTLVIPGLIIAAIVGAARLWEWWRRREPRAAPRRHALAMGALILAALLANLGYRNPVATTLLYREEPERIAAMRELAAMVPPGAPLAATSFLAPNMMPRRYIYYFPNSPSFPPIERADYLFIDMRAAALDTEVGRAAMAEVLTSGRWQLVASRADLQLFRQVR
jgi:Predicted membrane protein (DUF2079)